MSESLALDKKHQSVFARKVKKAKERVKSSGNVIEETPSKRVKPKHGLVYVGHIPHGFYEDQMIAYFKQFGRVSNLRVCRSKATGQSKGYAFVEFADAEVAKVAAETMDNYLMFNRRLIAKYVPMEKHLKRTYKGPSWSKTSYPLQITRKKSILIKNKNVDDDTHLRRSKGMIKSVNRSLKKLHELGIDYTFKAADDQNGLNKTIVVPGSSTSEAETEAVKDVKRTKPKRVLKKKTRKAN